MKDGDLYISHGRERRIEKEWWYLIVVSVRKDGVIISGHAGYAEAGKDIVCAGVTALRQTLIRSIEDLTSGPIQYNIAPGRADIYFKNLSEAGKLLVDSFFLGICSITEEFPENVKII